MTASDLPGLLDLPREVKGRMLSYSRRRSPPLRHDLLQPLLGGRASRLEATEEGEPVDR